MDSGGAEGSVFVPAPAWYGNTVIFACAVHESAKAISKPAMARDMTDFPFVSEAACGLGAFKETIGLQTL